MHLFTLFIESVSDTLSSTYTYPEFHFYFCLPVSVSKGIHCDKQNPRSISSTVYIEVSRAPVQSAPFSPAPQGDFSMEGEDKNIFTASMISFPTRTATWHGRRNAELGPTLVCFLSDRGVLRHGTLPRPLVLWIQLYMSALHSVIESLGYPRIHFDFPVNPLRL